MNSYRMTITEGPGITHEFECEAEDRVAAEAKAAKAYPGAKIGFAMRTNPMKEVPAKRSQNSRFHLVDVGKAGPDGAAPLSGQNVKPSGVQPRRRNRGKR